MANRRPPSAIGFQRSKPQPVAISTRSKSALSNSVPTTRTDNPPDEFTGASNAPPAYTTVPPTPSGHNMNSLLNKRAKKLGLEDNADSNIQVVVRCRGRSDREAAEASPVVVHIDGPLSSEVVIRTEAAKMELGVVIPPSTKTYPFDRVFGFASDQPLVYNEVVAPMLEQVLMGYNCTLFAYGQTGTGKTFTMQGDLTPSISGGPSAGAGMIPRVLANLFTHLEANVPDYSVKVSFVELYNEELRDLLSPTLSAPAGSEQPMSKGKSASGDRSEGLKIFEDARGGVFIQGVEETFVKNAADAVSQLRKGSDRRQIAATKFNDHSSRSHSVFTITVHTKAAADVSGEDYLRTGKFNLVDLAGSENIGRSGAENHRAREAGNINQSLLALGRVINALVDKSPHIPYRESKLTRLLQDSLGGRTKTCIIATISPAKCNLEETYSTLDYAIRAKSIRNKPEINQRMTRNSLLKEYIALIENLKADLLAAREKNGIYMSKESWDAMSAETQALQDSNEEYQRRCETLEAQIRAVREELNEYLGMLMKRDTELKETKETLRITSGELQITSEDLKNTKVAHAEDVVLREAYQRGEERLDRVATGLKDTVKRSVADVGGLFDKLARKAAIASSNSNAVIAFGKTLGAESSALTGRLEGFVKEHGRLTTKLKGETEQFRTAEVESLSALSSQVEQCMQTLTDSLGQLRANEAEFSDAAGHIQQVIARATDELKEGFEGWATNVQKNCATLCADIQQVASDNLSTAEQAMAASTEVFNTLVAETYSYLEKEQPRIAHAKALAHEAANAEICRLREQNQLLTQMLESQEQKSQTMQDELLKKVSSLVVNFTNQRNKSLRDAGLSVRKAMKEGMDGMEAFAAEHNKHMDAMLDSSQATARDVVKKGDVGRDGAEEMERALGVVGGEVRTGLTNYQHAMSDALNEQITRFERQKEEIDVGTSGAFARIGRSRRAQSVLTESFGADLLDGYRTLQSGLTSASGMAESSCNGILESTAAIRHAAQSYRNDAASHLSDLRQANKALQAQATREDIPTGTTPRKRAWEHDDDWERTQDRDTVLREWRQSQHRSKRPRLQSRSASVESRGHDPEKDIRASAPLSSGSEGDDAGADGDKTIRGEPIDGGPRFGAPASGAPAAKPTSEVLTGSVSSSASVPASTSVSVSVSGLPRSTASQSTAVRSSAVGVGKPRRLTKDPYITRGGSSNKGAPLADRNLVSSRIRKAR